MCTPRAIGLRTTGKGLINASHGARKLSRESTVGTGSGSYFWPSPAAVPRVWRHDRVACGLATSRDAHARAYGRLYREPSRRGRSDVHAVALPYSPRQRPHAPPAVWRGCWYSGFAGITGAGKAGGRARTLQVDQARACSWSAACVLASVTGIVSARSGTTIFRFGGRVCVDGAREPLAESEDRCVIITRVRAARYRRGTRRQRFG